MESVSYDTLNNNLNGPINTVQAQLNNSLQCPQLNVAIIGICIAFGLELFILIILIIRLNIKPTSTRSLLARLNN